MIFTDEKVNSYFPFYGEMEDYNFENTELPIPIEINIDFKNGEVITDENNEVEIVTKNNAIKVWCYLAIKTQRYKHIIYTDDYGSEHTSLYGQGFSNELIENEAFRYIKECLSVSPYIKEVQNRGTKVIKDTLYVNIYVETIYGDLNISEVI